jgi:virulence-associated protein VagC
VSRKPQQPSSGSASPMLPPGVTARGKGPRSYDRRTLVDSNYAYKAGPRELCISQMDIHNRDHDKLHRIHQQSQPGGTAAQGHRLSGGVHQVDILKIGRSRVIVPQGKRWDDLFQSGPHASEDFMVNREQPPAEEREPL